MSSWMTFRCACGYSARHACTVTNWSLAREPVVPAEPVSVLPEGDGTAEAVSDDLRASRELAEERANRDKPLAAFSQLDAENKTLREQAGRMAEDIERLTVERDSSKHALALDLADARADRDRFARTIEYRVKELDEARAEVTQLRTERDRLRAALAYIASPPHMANVGATLDACITRARAALRAEADPS